jgi:hypothetical protein
VGAVGWLCGLEQLVSFDLLLQPDVFFY